MEIAVNKAEKAGRRIEFGNTVYYFCSDECKEQFMKNPDRLVERPSEN